jgi:hypothetical protein
MEMDKVADDVEERIWREAERTRRNDEERHRREAEARERARREAILRIIEGEARIEHEAERLFESAGAEVDVWAEPAGVQQPVAAVVALALSALLAVVGFGTWLMHAEDVQEAERRAAVERADAVERASMVAEQQAARTRFQGQLLHLKGRMPKTQAPNNQ